MSATKFYPHRIIVPTVFMIRDHALAFVAAWLLSGSKWQLLIFESEEVINMKSKKVVMDQGRLSQGSYAIRTVKKF